MARSLVQVTGFELYLDVGKIGLDSTNRFTNHADLQSVLDNNLYKQ